MQGWMIALIAVAAAVALLAIAFIAGALIFVHFILGRRKEMSEKQKQKKGYVAENFGADPTWYNSVADRMTNATITAYDGIKLGARIIRQSERTGRVAVCCHGYGATISSTQAQAKMFYDRGFDVFQLAMRGHSGSGGKVGMAWIDRFDLLRWIDRIIADYGDTVQIALFGVSMGGSTVISVAGMNPPPQVKCIIDDCGFSSQYEEYLACLKGAGLPKCAIHLFNVGVKLVHGYSLYDADITKFAQNMTVPALFVHGENDSFVPFELGKKLFDACASEQKQFIAVPAAAHGCAYATDKQKYFDAFTAFVDSNISGSELVHFPDEKPVDESTGQPDGQQEQADAPQTDERPESANAAQIGGAGDKSEGGAE